VEFSSNLSAIYTKWCAQTFPSIFGLFFFDCNFVKNVAPPSDKNENYVVHVKEQSILKKKRWKLHQNRPINRHTIGVWTMSPTRRQTKRDIQKHQFPLLQPARAPISPKLCMLIENVVPITKGVNHFSIQRIVFHTGAKMLIFGHWRTE